MTEQDPASGHAERAQDDSLGRGGSSGGSGSSGDSRASEGLTAPQSWELAIEQTVRSILDVVEELALGLAHGQTPEPAWAEVVAENFQTHRRELLAADRGGRDA